MKLFILFIVVFLNSSFACDNQEAQVIMNVVSVETDSLTYCRAVVSDDSISSFNVYGVCPLSKVDVVDLGVDFPLINGHDCEVPEVISGVLVKKNQKIILD